MYRESTSLVCRARSACGYAREVSDVVIEILSKRNNSHYGRLMLDFAIVPSGEMWVVGGRGRNVLFRSDDGRDFQADPHKALMKKRLDGATGFRMISVFDDEIWMCGEWGWVGRSRDLGATWTRIPTGVRNCCWSLAHDADGNVWATADNGWVGYCTDGETWQGVQRGVSCSDEETWKNEHGLPGGIAWCQASSLGILLPAGKRLLIGNRGTVEMTGLEAPGKVTHAIVTPTGSLVATTHAGAFRSDDGGETFTKATISGTRKRALILHRVHAFPDGALLASGDDLLLFSEDDGRSFTALKHRLFKRNHERETSLYAMGVHNGGILVGGEDSLIARVAPNPYDLELD